MTDHKRDYTVDRRLLGLSVLALVVGGVSSLSALVLVELIHFFTNLFFFHTVSLANRSPSQHQLGPWVVLVPVAGGLIVGLMARYGSERIRGHGIPEAMETILYGKSKMSPRVAALKPLSSGIVIGSGGPFGAEGPIIMTGGSLGSLIAQYFRLTAAERRWTEETRGFWRHRAAYAKQQATRPQTIGYSLVDSPVGLLAWILDKIPGAPNCESVAAVFLITHKTHLLSL